MIKDNFLVATFYRFIDLPNFKEIQKPLFDLFSALNIKGTLLIAKEGINATLAGTYEDLSLALNKLQEYTEFKELFIKYSHTKQMPFLRLKVRLKKEIITFKQDNIKPSERTGERVDSTKWNELISDPNVIIIDTRNKYEVEIGTFKGALNPEINHFSQFAEFVKKELSIQKDKQIAMFCTGGIRCEKASAFMLNEGFSKVYQLDGGILKYLEQIANEQSLWQGECYIFDRRGSV